MTKRCIMRRGQQAIVAVAATLILAGFAAAQAPTSSTANPFHGKGTLAAGQTVELRGIQGDMNIEGVAGDEVEGTAKKSGEGAGEGGVGGVPGTGGGAERGIVSGV